MARLHRASLHRGVGGRHLAGGGVPSLPRPGLSFPDRIRARLRARGLQVAAAERYARSGIGALGDPRRGDEFSRQAVCELGFVAPRSRASSAGIRDAGLYALRSRRGDARRSPDTARGAVALRGRLRRDRGPACRRGPMRAPQRIAIASGSTNMPARRTSRLRPARGGISTGSPISMSRRRAKPSWSRSSRKRPGSKPTSGRWAGAPGGLAACSEYGRRWTGFDNGPRLGSSGGMQSAITPTMAVSSWFALRR